MCRMDEAGRTAPGSLALGRTEHGRSDADRLGPIATVLLLALLAGPVQAGGIPTDPCVHLDDLADRAMLIDPLLSPDSAEQMAGLNRAWCDRQASLADRLGLVDSEQALPSSVSQLAFSSPSVPLPSNPAPVPLPATAYTAAAGLLALAAAARRAATTRQIRSASDLSGPLVACIGPKELA